MSRVENLAGWTPIRVYRREGVPMVDWCDLSGRRFTDPFFSETVERALRHPFNRLFRHQTGLDTLIELQSWSPGLRPKGFIFHLSRCGSTVISQMLAALPQNLVISEAEPIEDILRLRLFDPALGEQQQLASLRSMIGSLGRPRAGETELFIKFDAWQTLDLPAIRRAFPNVPCVFVYRDPVEILASHLRTLNGRMMRAPLEVYLAGLDFAEATRMSMEEYWATVFATWCRAALAAGPELQLVEYRELPQLVPVLVRRYWGSSLSAEDETAMFRVTKRNVKNPGAPFAPDSAAKRREVPDELQQMVERIVGPLYHQLETARKAQRDGAGLSAPGPGPAET